jgi:hypothetical protein
MPILDLRRNHDDQRVSSLFLYSGKWEDVGSLSATETIADIDQ